MENERIKLENENRINPFDWEMIRMVEFVTKRETGVIPKEDVFEVVFDVNGLTDSEIKTVEDAVNGRLGNRILRTLVSSEGMKTFVISYDTKQYPKVVEGEICIPNPDAGLSYARRQYEVKALQVDRNNLDKLKEFTGGGVMEIPNTPGARGIYRFIDDKGIYFDVCEEWYITQDRNGVFAVYPEERLRKMFVRCEPIENVQELFDRLYGVELPQRFRKLREEWGELMEAWERLEKNPEDLVLQSDVVDELADVNAVLLHIANQMGVLPGQLLAMAYDKVRGREEDPEYVRKHPHVEREEAEKEKTAIGSNTIGQKPGE